MPIKPKNKSRYPENWSTEIVPRIRLRSDDRCEKCGIKNHLIIVRGEWNGKEVYQTIEGEIYDAKTSRYITSTYCGDVATSETARAFKVVLTVAHLDHCPENCDDSNLRHLCQKCHNQYDRGHRNQTRRNNKLKGQIELF